eukprot:m.343528 g.343528  ORF g.343528 m.343528 type:complete len:60 (+) comp20632_c0_seq2:2586-2765(+)
MVREDTFPVSVAKQLSGAEIQFQGMDNEAVTVHGVFCDNCSRTELRVRCVHWASEFRLC